MNTTTAKELLETILRLQAEGHDLAKIGLMAIDGDRDGLTCAFVRAQDEDAAQETGASALFLDNEDVYATDED